MDTSLSMPPSALTSSAQAPVPERSQTTKVSKIEATDQLATRPADKPFVAQVVSARLSGTDFPQNPSEIAPPDRTLRPYDVPMLPYSKDAETRDQDVEKGVAAATTASGPEDANTG